MEKLDPEIWGVINLTEDSFYAGSRSTATAALQLAETHFSHGAVIVDAGAESTRPGAQTIATAMQLGHLIPFVEGVRKIWGADFVRRISIDTRDIHVMRQLLDLGVGIINDVSGGSTDVYKLVAKYGATYVLMHTQGDPQTMQTSPHYSDILAEIKAYLVEHTARLVNSGVLPQHIIWDTGIGFGKTAQHNLQIIANHANFQTPSHKLLAGVSRKSFLGKIIAEPEPAGRLVASITAQMYLTLRGCDILRVHDVKEMSDALKIWKAIAVHEL